jgi:hypothetical protein
MNLTNLPNRPPVPERDARMPRRSGCRFAAKGMRDRMNLKAPAGEEFAAVAQAFLVDSVAGSGRDVPLGRNLERRKDPGSPGTGPAPGSARRGQRPLPKEPLPRRVGGLQPEGEMHAFVPAVLVWMASLSCGLRSIPHHPELRYMLVFGGTEFTPWMTSAISHPPPRAR